jgi:hypothetical protein
MARKLGCLNLNFVSPMQIRGIIAKLVCSKLVLREALTMHSALRHELSSDADRAMAQAVSPWLFTAEAQVHALDRQFTIFGGQSGTGTGFFRVLRLPLSI